MPETTTGASLGAALSDATEILAAAGCETPRLDAELLLAHALGVTRAELFMRAGPVASDRFDALLARRAAREPVAYIVGHKEFRRLSLEVDRRVLIPRPETELLVEVGLELPGGARVADVGTGSGAVALALKDERPDLELTGIDVSADALVLARENAARLSLDVRFMPGDLLVGGPYDAVLANLPYVADGDPLPPEIASFEPPEALFGGPEGLDVIRRLVDRCDAPLLALEVGPRQAGPVSAALERTGFRSVEVRRDLAGHERVVLGRRR